MSARWWSASASQILSQARENSGHVSDRETSSSDSQISHESLFPTCDDDDDDDDSLEHEHERECRLARLLADGRDRSFLRKTGTSATRAMVTELKKAVATSQPSAGAPCGGRLGDRRQAGAAKGLAVAAGGGGAENCGPMSLPELSLRLQLFVPTEKPHPVEPRFIKASRLARGVLACLPDCSATPSSSSSCGRDPVLVGPPLDAEDTHLTVFSLRPALERTASGEAEPEATPEAPPTCAWTAEISNTNASIPGIPLQIEADEDGFVYALSTDAVRVLRQVKESEISESQVPLGKENILEDLFGVCTSQEERGLCVNRRFHGEFATWGHAELRVWNLKDQHPNQPLMVNVLGGNGVNVHGWAAEKGRCLHSVAWSSHPRVLLAASDRLHFVDIRTRRVTPVARPTMEHLGGWELFRGDAIHALERHPWRDDLYAATAEDPLQVFLFDARAPHRPLHRWGLPCPVVREKDKWSPCVAGYRALHWCVADGAPEESGGVNSWLGVPCLGGKHVGLLPLRGPAGGRWPSDSEEVWPACGADAMPGLFWDVCGELPIDNELLGFALADFPGGGDGRRAGPSMFSLNVAGELTAHWLGHDGQLDGAEGLSARAAPQPSSTRAVPAPAPTLAIGAVAFDAGLEPPIVVAEEPAPVLSPAESRRLPEDAAIEWLEENGEQVAVVLKHLGLARRHVFATEDLAEDELLLSSQALSCSFWWAMADCGDLEPPLEPPPPPPLAPPLELAPLPPLPPPDPKELAQAASEAASHERQVLGRRLLDVLRSLDVTLPKSWVLIHPGDRGEEGIDEDPCYSVMQLARLAAQVVPRNREEEEGAPSERRRVELPDESDFWPVEGVRVLARSLVRAGLVQCACASLEAAPRWNPAWAGTQAPALCERLSCHQERYAPLPPRAKRPPPPPVPMQQPTPLPPAPPPLPPPPSTQPTKAALAAPASPQVPLELVAACSPSQAHPQENPLPSAGSMFDYISGEMGEDLLDQELHRGNAEDSSVAPLTYSGLPSAPAPQTRPPPETPRNHRARRRRRRSEDWSPRQPEKRPPEPRWDLF